MRTDIAPTPTLLADYAPFPFEITSVFLKFELDPEKTRVTSTLSLKRSGAKTASLELNGEDIQLQAVKLDGKLLARKDYKLTQTHLIIDNVPDAFELEITNFCAPKTNTQLMGLYVSGGRFCTQCEAEGFRRITYFPDRPDVLSTYRVHMSADKALYPTLLANGNKIDGGDLPNGQHFALWEDPFRKPCYLFAMVAGEFDSIADNFTTMSGRNIPLEIYVDPGDGPRAQYAMDALKRSMKWDEQEFGREYDLDLFMIVAVRDFNFGAMENKGLNIFNSALLLADAASATDSNFERIESVVAHEYFHNWTGNRITCRDWFQLCLKEGFTVFRDQEFSAHERGAALQRIKDVKMLRARQFPEDAGPLAHPVRPNAYLKIDNFYTATIYEKGAEIIRMLKTLLGAEDFRKGCDLYFNTLDGTAATVEEFIACFEQATHKDLSQFMRWYSQAGTPQLSIQTEFNPAHQDGTLTLKISQHTASTQGQAQKQDLLMPVSIALIHEDGHISHPQTIELSKASQEIEITGLNTTTNTTTNTASKSGPALSVLRDFSAPARLHMTQSSQDILRLMAHETDLFSRWEAGQGLARELLSGLARAIETGQMPRPNPALRGYIGALRSTLTDKTIDNGFKAYALGMPSNGDILQIMNEADPVAIQEAIGLIRRNIADICADDLRQTYHELTDNGSFSPDAQSAGRRALRNRALSLLNAQGRADIQLLAQEQFNNAANMTDELSAFMILNQADSPTAQNASAQFYDKWKSNPLVIDKWVSVMAMRDGRGALDHVKSLLTHPSYEPNNPNRLRALLGGFAMNNPRIFHAANGSGYAFFTDQIIELDARNPGVAARLLGVFETWPKLDKARQALIQSQLARIIAAGPSKNVLEIASKALGAS